ncbi:hypothetical protein CU102_24905 [Phyllobacterium brassicacearum]|uniref:Uncharacterized protein n=1 Tax=Phyllobacterium brassicacearum TaxID=314235 RepID=A0A2P7B831_9HYPH|nr:hypothetical protein [Phyllobacterium brassicacearum]PSH62615.1 hypothetical protein CU102_24905 [Phyllobacterium brassicacearum]
MADVAEWSTSAYHEFISRLPAIKYDARLVSLIGKHSFVTMGAFEIDDYASAINKQGGTWKDVAVEVVGTFGGVTGGFLGAALGAALGLPLGGVISPAFAAGGTALLGTLGETWSEKAR